MASTLTIQPTRRIGDFDLLEKVGQGGMGIVFRARDTRTQQIVALKIASRAVINDPFASKRFELEYEVSKPLNHFHLAKILEYGRDGDNLFLAMEYVDGPSLAQRLVTEGSLEEAAVLPMLLQMGEVLTYLHANQVIHRDIKPGNILFNSKGQAKLIDLGLSKNLDSAAELTRSRIGLGTMQFASPEQFEDARSVDSRSDIYSLAATLYLALTGEPPYGLGGPFSVLGRKLKNRFDPPISKNPRISAAADAAICLALHADRDKRPASSQEFVALFTGAKAVSTTEALPGHAPEAKEVGNFGSERRAGIRFATDLESNCRSVAGPRQPRWAATIKDISTTGICLCAKRRFEVGNVLDIMFSMQTDGTITTQHALVRWVRAAGGDAWLIGGEFANPLSQDDLETFFNERMNKTDML